MTADATSQSAADMPLAGISVVEIAGLPAAAYAARLMADFGAEVVKIEPPDGDPERRRLPLIDGHSAWFAYLNYGKKSVVPDAAAREALLANADVLILSGNADPGLSPAAAAIVARVDWFGPGPYRGYTCTDSICRALAGAIHLTGPIEGPPLALPDFQSGIIGGLATFIPVMAALLAREATGGRTIDVSIHEATVALSEYQAVEMHAGVVPRKRWGLNRFAPTYPLGIYPCRDGWLGVTIVTPAQWKAFCDLLGMPELGRHPDWTMGPDRLPKADALEARLLPRLREKNAAEWFALGLEHRLPFAIVPDMGELLSMPVFRERGAIVPIDLGHRVVEAPGSPFYLTVTPPLPGGAVPRPGQHTL
ncbi:MAG: CoA transferase, partial [Alphaproteobacteria bacterium]|nr:CoA transferase [Alphaproteobacteria bacterium]